ncbi:DUF3078 domain-containing protein [Hymenobacter sp. BT175]|uniref:DUF3078 domain-containing protein n=1 Tax=Hymenobacter translucens TaxID=2886507 RepID=UPI001D0E635B|nr:DUF3078 domain-containing protein [Hymenobacter translucens]MCC2547215.1 DUF3078 domain-containing protein [Hymenobacter translucens]
MTHSTSGLIWTGILLAFWLLAAAPALAQTPEPAAAAAPDTVQGWRRGGTGTVNFSQVSLSNWAPGGESSLSLLALGNAFAHHRNGHRTFDASLDVVYGTLKPGKARVRKNDDRVELNAKFGHQFTNTLYYAAQLNLKTQLTPTYFINKPDSLLSRFFAPAFVLASLGIDYKPNDQLSVFVSPLTGKFTIVADQQLADVGAFGVEPARRGADGQPIAGTGQLFRKELGAYINARYRRPVFENVTLFTKLDLFSNYLHRPENIDVNWETLLNLKVNKFISASVATTLVYDDDVLVPVDRNRDGVPDARGRRIQFKEALGIGLTYKF